MNRILLAILFFGIFSCRENNNVVAKTEAGDTTFQLIDNLGSITMRKPNQCDTFFSWIKRSDCGKPCEEGRYRFQPAGLPIFKESGFLSNGQPEDSVYQLTVSHQRTDTIIENKDSFAITHYSWIKEYLESEDATTNIISDTVQKIGDRYFCIFQIADIDKQRKILIRRLIAFTSISGHQLQFRYDLLTGQRDSLLKYFFDRSLKNLETVRIKDTDISAPQ